jgi:hypothetical protein
MKFVQSYPEPQAAPGGAEGPHAWWQRAAPAEGSEAPRFRGHLTTGGSACTQNSSTHRACWCHYPLRTDLIFAIGSMQDKGPLAAMD